MRNYEGRFKALEKKIPKDSGGDFITFHLERDNSYLGPNDERLTWEDLDAMDCNMMVMGWQKNWTDEQREANGLNGRLHIAKYRMTWYEGKTDEKSLASAARLEDDMQDIRNELKRKGLPIEEEEDNRFGAGCILFKIKGKGWLHRDS